MIDAEYRLFVEYLVQRGVEACALARSRPNGFSTITRAARRNRIRQALDDAREHAGRNRQIMNRPGRESELRAQLRDRSPGPRSRRRRSAAARRASAKHVRSNSPACSMLVARAFAQLVEVPAGARHADDRDLASSPRRTMACSAGNIFLNARSPVAPKNTKASDSRALIAALRLRVRGAAVRVPPADRARGRRPAS